MAERRVLAAPVRMSPSIDKVEAAHRAARLLQGAERQAWLAARKGAGSKADIKPMLLAPSDQASGCEFSLGLPSSMWPTWSRHMCKPNFSR